MVKIFLLFAFLFKLSVGAKILLYYCPYGKTHLLSFLPLLQQLGEDGHQVTVYHIDVAPMPNLGKNISMVHVNIPREGIDMAKFMDMLWTQTGHGFLVPFIYYMQGNDYNTMLTKTNNTFFQTISEDFDLVIIDELFTMHGIAGADVLKQRRNVPYIIYSPTMQTWWYQSMIALSRNYVASDSLFTLIPSKPTDYYKPTSFIERLIAYSESYVEVLMMNWLILPTTPFLFPGVKMREFFQNPYFTLGEHINKLGNPLTESNDLLLVGAHCKSASKVINATLPEEWNSFINDPKSEGTIYISFGSGVLWDYAPQRIKDAFLGAISQLHQYRVIISWNGEFPNNTKPHARFTKWAPQMAILSHPKTKVFLTHGGLKSLKESLCAEVPVVLMPLLAEQAYNAKFGLKLGIGLALSKYELSSERIVHNIKEIATNDVYRQKVQKLKSIYLDTPMDASKYGSFCITKFLKERKKFGSDLYDSTHENLLRRKGRLLNNLEFYGLDYLVVILGLIHFISK